jgi:hypothetical protein
MITTIIFDKDRVVIHTNQGPDEETTRDTMSRLGIAEDKVLRTIRGLLRHARSGDVPDPAFIAHARYHELLPLDHEEEPFVCLNVGGMGFCVSKKPLIDNFAYFRGMLDRHFRESIEEDNLFIDRDPAMFSSVLSYVQNPIVGVKPTSYLPLQRELEFFGYDKPSDSQDDVMVGMKTAQQFDELKCGPPVVTLEQVWEKVRTDLDRTFHAIEVTGKQSTLLPISAEEGDLVLYIMEGATSAQMKIVDSRLAQLGFSVREGQLPDTRFLSYN